jgi:hypothetical protein
MVDKLKERNATFEREEAALTPEQRSLTEELSQGRGDPARIEAQGGAAVTLLDRVIHQWGHDTKGAPEFYRGVCGLAAARPSLRMARALTAVFWNTEDAAIHAAAREALRRMPEPARVVLEIDLLAHDPPPNARRALYPALVDSRSPMAVPRMVEDVAGVGPWSTPGKGGEHARAILPALTAAGDRRAVPMMLHLMSARPPAQEVRAAITEAFASSPMKEEFGRGLEALKAGRPVVVTEGVSHEDFFRRWAKPQEPGKPERMQAELRRVSALWEDCWHERLGWRRPADAAQEIGPRERELRTALEREVREKMGRLAGRAPVAALEDEFRTRWLVTPRR